MNSTNFGNAKRWIAIVCPQAAIKARRADASLKSTIVAGQLFYVLKSIRRRKFTGADAQTQLNFSNGGRVRLFKS